MSKERGVGKLKERGKERVRKRRGWDGGSAGRWWVIGWREVYRFAALFGT